MRLRPHACLWLLLAWLASAAAPPAEAVETAWRLAPATLTIGGRTGYLLADGRHAVADEDARRVVLALGLHGPAQPILGWQDLRVDEAVTDAGEALAPILSQSSGILHKSPGAELVSIGLPPATKPYGGLRRLRGSLQLVLAGGASAHWRVPLARLGAGAIAIDGHEDLRIELEVEDGQEDRTALRLPLASALAVQAITVHGADGRLLVKKEPRREHHERQHPQPGDADSQLLVWHAALPADAVLDIEYLPLRTQVLLPFDITGLAFGLQLPGAPEGRSVEVRGANEL